MFEVFEDKSGKWRWRLRADNNEILATSEAYEGGEQAARNGVHDMVDAVRASVNQSGHQYPVIKLDRS